jgi:geranylgeranyl pyrophosphate synthase
MKTGAADAPDMARLGELRDLVEPIVEGAFEAAGASVDPLAEAIRYSLLAGGKRIRPMLCMAAADACEGDLAAIAPIAASFELIHAYSLVHDDLPAMDDDDLRRGMPTSHVRYGDATAILVGDALQARAFELVASAEGVDPAARVDVVTLLARAAGWQGMVGGQFLDIDEGRVDHADVGALRDVHDRKTGALIAGAIEAGTVAAGAPREVADRAAQFGRELGWLFQLVDDLLDATGSAAELGKTPGKDHASGKVTAISDFGGVDQLRDAVDAQLERCLVLAAALPGGGGLLPDVARFVHARDH